MSVDNFLFWRGAGIEQPGRLRGGIGRPSDCNPQPLEITSYFFGGLYETHDDGVIRKYYAFAGGTFAMRAYDPATETWSLNYFLTDHLGSVNVVLDANGTVLSQQRYLPFGGERTNIGNITQTDFGYTGQRDLDPGMGGLMDYRARMYLPYLNRFIQPDSIVPGPANPQAWNRYSYVMNNAINFNDPSGHFRCNAKSTKGGILSDEDCFDAGGDGAISYGKNRSRRDIGGADKDPSGRADPGAYGQGYELESPTFGFHLGNTTTIDAFYGKYYYKQTDYLFNLKTGTFYTTKTTGTGVYVGGINGASHERYVGLSNVHGIPLSASPEEIVGYLDGGNYDFSADAGADLLLEVSGGTGYSVDKDKDGKPIITTAGLMYTNEMKIVGVGVSVLPSPVDGGIQLGNSYTIANEEYYQIPWWPFR